MAPPSACGFINIHEHLHMRPWQCGYLLPLCAFSFWITVMCIIYLSPQPTYCINGQLPVGTVMQAWNENTSMRTRFLRYYIVTTGHLPRVPLVKVSQLYNATEQSNTVYKLFSSRLSSAISLNVVFTQTFFYEESLFWLNMQVTSLEASFI